jgi:signal transduction histidine kinase
VRITGPVVNWDSHPEKDHGKHTEKYAYSEDTRLKTRSLERTTADGHRIRFGLGDVAWENQPRRVGGITLVVLLLLTALAYAYVRRLLRPLDDIRQGAERFGAGDFSHTIPLRHRDELGDLAQRINTMAHELQQMLDAKRALLLAISHELRSPLTRARLNVELLPETEDAQPLRAALLRDLAGMRDLINDLMESERLAGQHAVLSREVTDRGVLAQEVVHELLASLGGVSQTIMVDIAPNMPLVSVDRARLRLLVRNLLDNALRHSAGATLPPELYLRRIPAGVELQVRDHGPGVAEDQLPQLAQAFYRADSARQRTTGGVGLGLYLCRLVALAHGGTWAVRNAAPGLEITVKLPLGL